MEAMYDEKTLRKLQEAELMILKEFIRICEMNEIRYFGLYGTAIGAVRHRGIIPWDDDIDVGMLRRDYEKFVKMAKTQLAPEYLFMNAEVNENYPLMTARIMKKGTEFRDLSLKGIDCEFGIFLDIFIYDNIAPKEKDRKKQFRDALLYNKLQILRIVPYPNIQQEGIKRAVLHFGCVCVHKILSLFFKKDYFYKKCKKAVMSFDGTDTEYVGYLCDALNFSSVVKKSDIFPLKSYKFEDIMLKLPHNNHEMLTKVYGDYMKIPPVNKRCGFRPYKLDFGKGK